MTIETTDGRFVQVGRHEWWDTDGIEIVDEEILDEYLRTHPRVGMIVKDGLIMEMKAYRLIDKAINADLAAALAKHGFKLTRVRAGLDPMCGTVRYTIEAADVNMKDSDGNATTPEMKRWNQSCALYDLKPEWLGREYKSGGRTYTVAGLRDTRGEKCVNLTRDDGKTFVTKPEALHFRFGGGVAKQKAMQAAMTEPFGK